VAAELADEIVDDDREAAVARAWAVLEDLTDLAP
jgi:hypothetical protein